MIAVYCENNAEYLMHEYCTLCGQNPVFVKDKKPVGDTLTPVLRKT